MLAIEISGKYLQSATFEHWLIQLLQNLSLHPPSTFRQRLPCAQHHSPA